MLQGTQHCSSFGPIDFPKTTFFLRFPIVREIDHDTETVLILEVQQKLRNRRFALNLEHFDLIGPACEIWCSKSTCMVLRHKTQSIFPFLPWIACSMQWTQALFAVLQSNTSVPATKLRTNAVIGCCPWIFGLECFSRNSLPQLQQFPEQIQFHNFWLLMQFFYKWFFHIMKLSV